MIEFGKEGVRALYKADVFTDSTLEDNIVCPYCGYEIYDDDRFYMYEGGGILECPDCGKDFEYYPDVVVKYSTRRIAEPSGQNVG